jgi:hypothetical protein
LEGRKGLGIGEKEGYTVLSREKEGKNKIGEKREYRLERRKVRGIRDNEGIRDWREGLEYGLERRKEIWIGENMDLRVKRI